MGKNITEFGTTPDKAHVGGVTYFQADQALKLQLAGKIFVKGSQQISREAGEFGQDLADYINENVQDLVNTRMSLSTEVQSSWGTVLENAPKAKNYHWHEEIVLGAYSYMPISDSSDYGNARFLGYLRVDGTNQTVTRHNINYVGASTPVDTSQTYAGFLMVSTGTKLLAYFRTNAGWDCHTSTDGLTWIDETSSFSLATTVGYTTIYTQNTQRANRNCFAYANPSGNYRFHTITWYGSRFVWIGNDGTNFKIWNSPDGLAWTDITTSIYSGTTSLNDSYFYNISIDISQNKAFIAGRSSSADYIGAYTVDGGATWSQSTGFNDGGNNQADQLVKNPLDPDKFLLVRTSAGNTMMQTDDFGATWTFITLPEVHEPARGIAYFGDYIYWQGVSSVYQTFQSADNGANWSYFDETMGYNNIMTDSSRIIFMSSREIVYSTDNITFNRKYLGPTLYGRDSCVAIDANTTIFGTQDDDTFVYTTDGCVTFKTSMKYEERASNFCFTAGVSTREVGYLASAKMIGNVITTNAVDDNNIFFVERIKDPQWANTPTGSGNMTASDTATYFRTK
jgi:hypothetical protein